MLCKAETYTLFSRILLKGPFASWRTVLLVFYIVPIAQAHLTFHLQRLSSLLPTPAPHF